MPASPIKRIGTVFRQRYIGARRSATRLSGAMVGFLRRSIWPELMLLVLVALPYSFGILNFDPAWRLPGNEFTVHTGTIELFIQWLRGTAEFPLWNPIVGYGRSLIADPFLFTFNPFISAPLVLLGVVNGSKLAVLLHLLIAGAGVWCLAKLLDFGRPARIWCSVLYMLSGAIPSHLAVGHFQLSLSLCWLPWSVFGLVWALRSRRVLAVAVAALAQALFFFSGNLYYQTFAGFCLLIIGLVCVVDWKQLRLRTFQAKRFALVGALSAALIAVQLLPMLASAGSMHNDAGFVRGDPTFPGSQLPHHAMLNYLVSDHRFYLDSSLGQAAYLPESYRYIGLTPFLFMLFLVPAFRNGNRREIIGFAASFAFLIGWAGLRYSPVRFLLDLFPILYQFRFPGRALSVGILFAVMLSGFGLNYLWLSLERLPELLRGTRPARSGNTMRGLRVLAELTMVAFIFGGIRSAYQGNKELFFLEPTAHPEARQAASWLVSHQNPYTRTVASYTITDDLTLQAYRSQLRLHSLIDGWTSAPAPAGVRIGGPLLVRPAIQLDWVWDALDTDGYELVYQVGELRIWQDPAAFPDAFLVAESQLRTGEPVGRDQIDDVISYQRDTVNSIQVELDAGPNSVLVITESWFDDWVVTVDGQQGRLVAVDDFLAIRVPPGRHTVSLQYAPWSFTAGALISGVTLLAMLAWPARSLLARARRRRETSAG